MEQNKSRNIVALLAIILGIGSAALGAFSFKQAEKPQKFVDELTLGFSPATKYKSSLSTSITSTDTTITVASIKEGGGADLTTGNIGSEIFLSIEPGTTREEIVRCIGISGLQFTGCTRGLNFSGRSLDSSSTLRIGHNGGSVIQLSNVHYVYQQLLGTNDVTQQYVSSTFVYTSSTPMYFGNASSVPNLKCPAYVRRNETTSTFPYWCYSVSDGFWIASNNGVDTFQITPTSSVTQGGRGVVINSGVIDVTTTTTRAPGLAFLVESARERLYIPTSTASDGLGWLIGIDSTGLFGRVSTTRYSGLALHNNASNASGTLYYTGEYWDTLKASSTALFTGLATFYNGFSATNTAVSSTIFGGLVLREPLYASTSVFGTSATTTIANNLLVQGNLTYTGQAGQGVKWVFISADSQSGTTINSTPPAEAKAAIVRVDDCDDGGTANLQGSITPIFASGFTAASSTISNTTADPDACEFGASWIDTTTLRVIIKSGGSSAVSIHYFR